MQDLTPRITAIIEDLPVEVLLVRRSKKSRQAMPNNQTKITLNELSLADVFETRLAQETWQSDEEVARHARLNTLFTQAVAQVQLGESTNSLNDSGLNESTLNKSGSKDIGVNESSINIERNKSQVGEQQ